MTSRTTIVPLGFGLSAMLCVSATDAEEKATGTGRPPVRVYTNEDLDRVHPWRNETGVASVPAVPPSLREALPEPSPRKGARGEDYWRREAARVRDRVRALEAQAAAVRASIAEREEESRLLTRRRRSASSTTSESTLRTRLDGLERRARQLQADLEDRARREGALPGWLR